MTRRAGQPQKTTAATLLGDHASRIRRLEFRKPGTRTGPRIVSGAIYNDANIIAGTGFTAELTASDLITVTFDEPFEEPGPIVALTPNNNNPADAEGEYVVSLKTRDPDFIVVEGKELDGTPNIGGFDFIAIEAAA